MKQETSTTTTSAILSAARNSALRRSTARSLAAPQVRSSLRYISNLADPNAVEVVEDILADLKNWDAYEALYEIRKVGYHGEKEEKTVGGGIKSEVWGKAIRASVTDLFLKPLVG